MASSASRNEGPNVPLSREASSGDDVKKPGGVTVEAPKRASLPVRVRDKVGLDVGTLRMMFKSVELGRHQDWLLMSYQGIASSDHCNSHLPKYLCSWYLFDHWIFDCHHVPPLLCDYASSEIHTDYAVQYRTVILIRGVDGGI